ncbi:hypothetical protein RHMOL_Rhmol09G0001300 [Rhododendron molle]|uniref:Uncharacterized protein n=1 Tax=Rhododendron molle TaxID=49168 RepID=A0ACC0M848_RHOML|nr:hypothetical protein RHMOL_Rhmol09G0001300 [Rhododendron molle]
MDTRAKNPTAPFPKRNMNPVVRGGRKTEYRRSYSQVNSRRIIRSSCYGLESLLVLVCLTASLLLLPLILPPLPPPPLMLLLLPIGILAVLVILAFRPTTTVTRDVTHSAM